MGWRELFAYWGSHRVDGHPPSRADIDPPIDIPQLLPNLMLYDVTGDGFRLRLTGSELVRRSGKDLTGQVLDPNLPNAVQLDAFLGYLERIVADQSPLLISVGRGEVSPLGAMMVLLPLVKSGNVEMILGGVFYEPVAERHLAEGWRPGAFTELSLEAELKRDAGVRWGR